MGEELRRAFVAARAQVRSAAVQVARARFGEAAVESRPRSDSDPFPETSAAPLAAVWAVDAVIRAAREERRWQVRLAREAGHSWHEIGEALELDSEGGSLAEAAYEHVVEPQTWPAFREPVFVWHCPACDAAIADLGPYEVYPADCERGHTGDCPRLVAEIAAWPASVDTGEEES